MRLITKNAFTLAEVLITLAIIGVVAAMTMPTLINNTNGAQFKTAYKKALSVLNQAVVMNIALDDYDLAGTSTNNSEDASISSLYKMFTDRTNASTDVDDDYKVYLSTDGKTVSTTATELTNNYVFRFQDGIIFSFPKDAANCTEGEVTTEASKCKGFIDVNGTKGPNRSVVCKDNLDEGECNAGVTVNDIFPIRFYDQTVAPNSAAARAVLYGSENQTAVSGGSVAPDAGQDS